MLDLDLPLPLAALIGYEWRVTSRLRLTVRQRSGAGIVDIAERASRALRGRRGSARALAAPASTSLRSRPLPIPSRRTRSPMHMTMAVVTSRATR